MFRLSLNGHEKTPGKDHEDTKRCARNLAGLHWSDKAKMKALVLKHPHLVLGYDFRESFIRNFIYRA